MKSFAARNSKAAREMSSHEPTVSGLGQTSRLASWFLVFLTLKELSLARRPQSEQEWSKCDPVIGAHSNTSYTMACGRLSTNETDSYLSHTSSKCQVSTCAPRTGTNATLDLPMQGTDLVLHAC